MNIFIYEHSEIHPKGIELLQSKKTVILTSDDHLTDFSNVKAIMVRSYTQVNQELLLKYPDLRFVLRVGVGLDNIDLQACKARNITVLSSRGANANAVAELSLTFMLNLLRKIDYQRQQLEAGKWRDITRLGSELQTQTIGLIGCGAVGKKLSEKLAGLGVKNVLGFDPYMTSEAWNQFQAKKSSWEEIWENSDVVSVQVPLTKETHHSISTNEFSMMKKGSHIVNVGRGGVVDESALLSALNSNILAGAALDVFEGEPTVNKELLFHPSIIATPHIAALTTQAQEAMTMQVIEEFVNLQ